MRSTNVKHIGQTITPFKQHAETCVVRKYDRSAPKANRADEDISLRMTFYDLTTLSIHVDKNARREPSFKVKGHIFLDRVPQLEIASDPAENLANFLFNELLGRTSEANQVLIVPWHTMSIVQNSITNTLSMDCPTMSTTSTYGTIASCRIRLQLHKTDGSETLLRKRRKRQQVILPSRRVEVSDIKRHLKTPQWTTYVLRGNQYGQMRI